MEHIKATPGFVDWSWPHSMTLAENRADLEMHARHFRERRGFTYTVLERGSGDVIGCVYIYPAGSGDAEATSDQGRHDASVRSWVTAKHAALDERLWTVVTDWLHAEWPFERVVYAPRA